ncbi:MAG: DUF302 domain-containing protein [Thermomicrobia bacterium]|nr:DUF302 domain-containing protein [Thermomicrobia bacterium]
MNTTTDYGFGTMLALPFAEAMARTKAALKGEGFGVLSEIDVQATLKEKIAVDFERYVILGACNPQLAYRGLQAEHELGLLLPCNVVVHDHDGGTMVSIVDPAAMLGVADNPALREIADEARTRLQRVAASLAGTAETEGAD